MSGLFDMFRGMGQLAGLMKNLPKLREEMEQFQVRLSQVVVEGDAGAGMVKVRCNGRMEIIAVVLSEEALKSNDREMLEDLIRAATNQALTRAKQQAAEETNKMAANLGLPPGMGLPGLG
jgi:DNA-binding YbaB/EbfC family protein